MLLSSLQLKEMEVSTPVICSPQKGVVWANDATYSSENIRNACFATGQRPIRICRTDDLVSDKTKSKLADLCDVHVEAVWTSITVADISQLPLHFYRQGVLTMVSSRLGLTVNEPDMGSFRGSSPSSRELEVAVNGKYEHQDAYISIFRALEDAARACGASVTFRKGNCDTSDKVPDALCVPGGFGARGFEELVELCQFSRVEELPFLGICWGFQAAVIALARDFGYPRACSQEVEEDAMPPHAIVVKRRDGILRKGRQKSEKK